MKFCDQLVKFFLQGRIMIGNTNFNLTQSINSFLRPMGLSLSSKEQITAKATMLALGIILVANNLPLASAHRGCWQRCVSRCGEPPNSCFNKCLDDCYKE